MKVEGTTERRAERLLALTAVDFIISAALVPRFVPAGPPHGCSQFQVAQPVFGRTYVRFERAWLCTGRKKQIKSGSREQIETSVMLARCRFP